MDYKVFLVILGREETLDSLEWQVLLEWQERLVPRACQVLLVLPDLEVLLVALDQQVHLEQQDSLDPSDRMGLSEILEI